MINARTAIRETLAHALLATGIAALVRRVIWRDRVAILLYHDPSAATLDAHLAYLKTICDIVTLEQANTPGSGRPRAVITFDDGHAANAALLPVFQKHGVKPTIYLCSGVVAHPRIHWWKHPKVSPVDTDRWKLASNRERLDQLEKLGFVQDAPAHSQQASGLTKQEIDVMIPFVDFQSHTRFHPVLPNCDDTECAMEVEGSKQDIEQLTGLPCSHFAYPNGNYRERDIAALIAAGYKSARTCDVGWNDVKTDPFRLRAIEMQDESSVAWFAAQLSGIPMYVRNLLNGGSWRGLRLQRFL